MTKKITVLVTILTLLSVSVLVWAVSKTQKSIKPAATVLKLLAPRKYDLRLLANFNKAATRISTAKEYTFSGTLNISDGSDTSLIIHGMTFLCAKKGNSCYFRFGDTETLNVDGYCIYIHNAQKKVVVSPQKALSAVEMPGLQTFDTNMGGENYTLKVEKKGSSETIAFENNKHISCKAYRLTFDTVTMDTQRIYARLTNPADPLNMAKDKVIDMAFSYWTPSANLKHYLTVKDVIRQKIGKVELSERYKDYELLTAR